MAGEEDEIRELKERLARLEGAGPATPAPPPVPAPRGAGCGGWVAGGIALLFVLYLIGRCTPEVGSPGALSASTSWTPPAGYSLEPGASGGGIATQWETPTSRECRGSGVTCFAINVITERDCPRALYASITLLGEGGDNMGWTNDTAQGVQAGERTRLVFDTYERGVKSARIAEINCY